MDSERAFFAALFVMVILVAAITADCQKKTEISRYEHGYSQQIRMGSSTPIWVKDCDTVYVDSTAKP